MRGKRNIFEDFIEVGSVVRFFLDDEPLTVVKVRRRLELGTLSIWYEAVTYGAKGEKVVANIDMFRPFDNNPCAMVD